MNEKVKQFLGEERKLLCLIQYGSKLYGMDTPESDSDFVGVYLPSKRDYLLCNTPNTLV